MVAATLAFIMVITNTPRKLNTAAIIMALRTPMALVETHVAMALGASVHPFTNITARVSSTVMARTGLLITCSKNDKNEIVIL